MGLFSFLRPKPKPYKLPIDPKRVHALHVGINAYKRSPLQLCVNDIIAVKKLFASWGVLPENTVTLLDREATTVAIKNALQDGVDKLKHGDCFVVQYSGHGSNLPCAQEMDGNMEIICPVDIEDDFEQNNVPDWFIGDIARQVTEKGATMYLLPFDCCHTGGITRDLLGGKKPKAALEGARYLPAPKKARYRGEVRRFKDEDKETNRIVAIGGCEAGEVSYEYSEAKHGAATWALLDAVKNGLPTPRALHKSIYNQVQGAFPTQHPVLEGNEAYFDIPYFTEPK